MTYPCILRSALKLHVTWNSETSEIGIRLMDCLDRYTEEPAYDETFGAKVFKVSRT